MLTRQSLEREQQHRFDGAEGMLSCVSQLIIALMGLAYLRMAGRMRHSRSVLGLNEVLRYAG